MPIGITVSSCMLDEKYRKLYTSIIDLFDQNEQRII